jgi:hypothetical protein
MTALPRRSDVDVLGDGGRMGAPPAIEDALRPLGVRIDALPACPRACAP